MREARGYNRVEEVDALVDVVEALLTVGQRVVEEFAVTPVFPIAVLLPTHPRHSQRLFRGSVDTRGT